MKKIFQHTDKLRHVVTDKNTIFGPRLIIQLEKKDFWGWCKCGWHWFDIELTGHDHETSKIFRRVYPSRHDYQMGGYTEIWDNDFNLEERVKKDLAEYMAAVEHRENVKSEISKQLK